MVFIIRFAGPLCLANWLTSLLFSLLFNRTCVFVGYVKLTKGYVFYVCFRCVVSRVLICGLGLTDWFTIFYSLVDRGGRELRIDACNGIIGETLNIRSFLKLQISNEQIFHF